MASGSWTLTNVPRCCKTLGSEWLFNTKLRIDEIIDKFKVKHVVQWFNYENGVDYFDTYSSVTKVATFAH